MRILKLVLSLALIFSPVMVLAQQPSADMLLNHITGKWLLKGTIAGADIEHDITATWVLGHQYIELKETSRHKQADGMPDYDAMVFISRDNTKNQYDCLWLDNTSNSGLANEIIAHAPVKPDTLAFLFKISDHSYFHTTLSYNAANNCWHWLLTSDENGKMEVFADAMMVKVA
jgi:hypothetical protein